MRKAQGQPLLLALLAILAVLLLVFGYQGIQNLGEQTATAETITFENTVKDSVKEVIRDYGKITVKTFHLPDGFDEACFVDLNYAEEVASNPTLNPIIRNSIEDGTLYNAFLVGDKVKAFEAGSISISQYPHFICFPGGNGPIDIKFEGVGGSGKIVKEFRAEISIPPEEEMTLESADGIVELEVPRTVRATNPSGPIQSIAVEPESFPTATSDFFFLSGYYDFSPEGTTFVPPLKISMHYSPASLPSGLDETELAIIHFDGDSWTALPSTVDTENKIVYAYITGFSGFALGVPTEGNQEELSNLSYNAEQEEREFNWQLLIATPVLVLLAIIIITLSKRKKNDSGQL